MGKGVAFACKAFLMSACPGVGHGHDKRRQGVLSVNLPPGWAWAPQILRQGKGTCMSWVHDAAPIPLGGPSHAPIAFSQELLVLKNCTGTASRAPGSSWAARPGAGPPSPAPLPRAGLPPAPNSPTSRPSHQPLTRPPLPPPHRLGDAAALWPVDFKLHHLALDDLCLLLDAHADGLAEGLGRGQAVW